MVVDKSEEVNLVISKVVEVFYVIEILVNVGL